MAQEYRVLGTKIWQGTEDPTYGTKLSLSLEGIGEPVDAQFKNIPSIGDVLYGHIETYKTAKGAERKKFKREPRQNKSNSSYSNGRRGYDSDGQSWGNAKTNGMQIAINCVKTGDAYEIVKTGLALAEIIYLAKPPESHADTVTNFSEPIVTAEELDEPLDMSKIPF